MLQHTETYRIKVSKETKQKLIALKKYNIVAQQFIRQAIDEKFENDLPKLKVKKEKINYPF